MPRMSRTRWMAAVGAAGVVLLGAFATIQRIPPGHVALAPQRLRDGSWTLHRPFTPLILLRTPGEVSLPSVSWRTKEGSTLEFSLALDYALERPIAPQLVADARRLGWDDAIRAFAEQVVGDVGRRVDTETLLSRPDVTEAPLRAALEAAGVQVIKLSLRSRVGDELVRRTRTEEARRLARPQEGTVVLIGWDGADWDIARPLMAAGRMPHLARMVREGSSAPLRSYDPMFSPLLWTTVATGKSPTEHGIADFLVRDAGSEQRRPITSDFRKVKALWNILSDFDRRSTWIGWWASFPAESSRGMVVSDYLGAALASKTPDEAAALPGVVSPPGALRRPAELLVTRTQIPRSEVARIIPVTEDEYRAALDEFRKPAQSSKDKTQTMNPVAFVMHVLSVTRSYHNIALSEVKAGSPFVAVYYEGIDMMGHGFQHYLPPKMTIVSDSSFERYREAVPRFYEYQDELLGELLAAAGPRAVAMLVSDHGFRTGDDRPDFAPSTKGQPEEWHRDWGILAIQGPGVRRASLSAASIYDVTPTLLYLSGLPLASDMEGRLLVDALDPVLIRRLPPGRLGSYELVGARLEHTAEAVADPAALREMMANLRALGYVGGADEGPSAKDGAAQAPPGATETQYFFHRNLAVLYIRQGRYADAEAELLAANQKMPRGKTFEMLSQVRANQERYADAVRSLEEGWETVPDQMNPSSLLWIIDLRLLSGDRDAAQQASTTWASRMSPAVRIAAEGRLREALGDDAAATQAYREALTSDPLMVGVAQRLNDLYLRSGQPFALEPFLLETVATSPKVDAYWDMAGQIAMARGDHQEAVARFRKANALQPDDGRYLGRLASALAAAGREEEASETLAWADRVPHTTADAWMALGSAWDRLGEADRAVRAFEAAKSAGLRGPGADIGAVLALARAGRTADALKVLAEAEARFPKSQALAGVRGRLGR